MGRHGFPGIFHVKVWHAAAFSCNGSARGICADAYIYIVASEASSVTNCANLRFLVYIFIYLFASGASAVINCANLRFLVYIFIAERLSARLMIAH